MVTAQVRLNSSTREREVTGTSVLDIAHRYFGESAMVSSAVSGTDARLWTVRRTGTDIGTIIELKG